jgi:hypothetical protein
VGKLGRHKRERKRAAVLIVQKVGDPLPLSLVPAMLPSEPPFGIDMPPSLPLPVGLTKTMQWERTIAALAQRMFQRATDLLVNGTVVVEESGEWPLSCASASPELDLQTNLI